MVVPLPLSLQASIEYFVVLVTVSEHKCALKALVMWEGFTRYSEFQAFTQTNHINL